MIAPLSVVGIVRYHRPADQFEPIRRSFLRNPEISLRAFRVGGYILSHVAGFVQTQREIARGTGLSVTTVRAALDDLRSDGYLVSRRIREAGRWIGTAYAVSDIPFTEEELAMLCPPGAESERTESEHSESTQPKKTTPVRETTSPEKTSPSGGPAVAGGLDSQEVHPMPRSATPQQPGLFEVEVTVEPRQAGKTTTQAIVAAYVDSHREFHGSDPTRSEIGRVARDAKRLIGNPATVEQLIAAAAAMGCTPFANIAVQLKKANAPAGKGLARAHPHGSPEWAALAAETDREVQSGADEYPELAAWRAGMAASA